jgi:hypothetical protein
MTLRALETIGTELGLTFTKHHSRERRARLILDKYAELDLQAPPDKPPSPSSVAPVLADPKPEFERLIDSAAQTDPESPSRGGAGRGQGRTEGMTDEFATYKRLSPIPNPFIQGLFERFFDDWSKRVGNKDIKLTEDQAVRLALSWTHAYELTPIAGKLPPWCVVLLECGWSTYTIIGEKVSIARVTKDAERKEREANKVPVESLN